MRSVLTVSVNLGSNSAWDGGVHACFALLLMKVTDVECSDPHSREYCDLCRVRHKKPMYGGG